MGERQRFYTTHLAMAVLLVCIGLWLGEWSQGDVAFSRLFFDADIHRFPWSNNWFLEGVMHGYGKKVGRVIAAVVLLLFCASFFWSPLKPWRTRLVFLVLAMATGPVLVVELKQLTNVHCPNSLTLFGGDQLYHSPFQLLFAAAKDGTCWPAGHASYGFALLPFYFALRDQASRRARQALVIAIVWGNVLGLERVIQGSHFLSHQFWSWAICWLAAMFWYVVLLRRDLLPYRAETSVNCARDGRRTSSYF